MQDWTVDIREMFKEGLQESDLSDLLREYEARGYKVNQIYCTDEQREKIKDFTEKVVTDKRTKEAKELQKYAGITLTVG